MAGACKDRRRAIEVGRHESVAVRVGRVDCQADLGDFEVDRLDRCPAAQYGRIASSCSSAAAASACSPQLLNTQAHKCHFGDSR